MPSPSSDRRRTDTRRRVLDIAERLLMQRGYNAFSYQHIAGELGVKTAAVHYHFPAKAELAQAVVERYGQRFDAWAASLAAAPPEDRVLAYFALGHHVVADGRVCALAMLTAELASLPDPLRAAVVAVQGRILAFYTESLDQARAAGAVRFSGSAADMGAQVACALVGAQQLARAFGIDVYDRVMAQQAAGLGLDGPWPTVASPYAGERA